jgi:hypothetical protein
LPVAPVARIFFKDINLVKVNSPELLFDR